ncbi:hypothetical protein [Listeria grayi]|uniref:hypothetical protein n=1 Tax=Listeria grayi TaxID=1641 RepID=UPI00162642B0|nr:hypothetical protein [Listeria grayi]MBC1921958.1 hypothetical protein [Listeria grayi]
MEISITITGKVDEIKQAMKEFIGEEVVPTQVKKKKAASKKVEDTPSKEVGSLYSELENAVGQLPNGEKNDQLRTFLVQEFNAPNISALDEKQQETVLNYAKELLVKEEPTNDKPERVVTKQELTEKGKSVVDAGKRKELKSVLDQFGASKLTALEEKDYAAVMEALEAL